jgi:hypothetical protein
MKIRHALTGTTAAVLLFVGATAGDAAAQTVKPNTGATTCTATNVHQYTRYHGTICYGNTGDDDLATSAFWTAAINTGCNYGYINYYDTKGNFYNLKQYVPHQNLEYPTNFPTDVVSLVWIHIEKIQC